jgi:hypothetical protein
MYRGKIISVVRAGRIIGATIRPLCGLKKDEKRENGTMRIISLTGAALLMFMLATSERAQAGVFVSITVAPPPLVVYSQPPIPGPGYMWTPGYWSWDEEVGDYYWVPGAWVPAPEPGLLWTPGYWGWVNGVYIWHAGYWGPHVGFYGGVNYGYGYGGAGFVGGRWEGGVFSYNRAVMVGVGVGVSVNVYSQTVINNNTSRVCFNGGNGGVRSQPSAQELAFANERHVGASQDQLKHQHLASKNPDLKFASNHGKPAIAATRQAGNFSKGNIYAAKPGGAVKPTSYKPTSFKPQAGPGNAARSMVHNAASATPGAHPLRTKPMAGKPMPPKNAALARRPGPMPHPAAKKPEKH